MKLHKTLHCSNCDSTNLSIKAIVVQDTQNMKLEVIAIHDTIHLCRECLKTVTIVERAVPTEHTEELD